MGKIPYQCVFSPSDHGLIRDFLNCKLRGEALMYDDAVFELERHYIYGGKTPWDIFYATIQQENEDAVYLFTTPAAPIENNASTVMLNNNNNNSNGAWKARRNGSSVPVTDPDNGNQVIGFKKSFIYEKKSNSKKDGVQWFLTEYTTLQPPIMQSLNLVVCKIEKIVEW